MSDIRATCENTGTGYSCRVTVDEGGSRTEHEVTIGQEDMRRLAISVEQPEQLVVASFEFLLEREPKEAILPRFGIGEIERYFPEYRNEISPRLRPKDPGV